MSASKARTRFTIEVAGKPRELFSVLERASGDLVILVKQSAQASIRAGSITGPFADMVEDRFSVHTSPQSPGFTLTYTQSLVGSRAKRAATFVVPSGGYLIWPLLGFRPPNLDGDRYLAKIRACDDVANIDRFDPKSGTLIYYIVISNYAAAKIIHAKDPFKITRKDFRAFSVLVFHTFILSTSLRQGHATIFPTSALTSANEVPTWSIAGGAQSLSPEKLHEFLFDQLSRFRDGYLMQLSDVIKESSLKLSHSEEQDIINMANSYSSIPLDELLAANR